MKIRLLAVLLVTLCAASTASALLWIVPRRFAAPSGGGGGGPVVAHVVTGGTSGGVTSASVDTTGANLIVLAVCGYLSNPTPTDSKGNTWTLMTTNDGAMSARVRMYYCVSPTVGSGHTFSSGAAYASIGAIALSGMSGGLDVQSAGAATSSTTSAPGSITTTQANTVLVSCTGFDVTGTTVSIDNSLTITDQIDNSGGNYYGFAMSYKVLTATATAGATWTANQSQSNFGSIIGAFKY